MTKHTQNWWKLGALLLGAPVVAVLPGCGGGTDSSLFTPPPAGSQTFAAPVSFGNGQSGTLNLTTTSTTASGTLIVQPRAAQQATRNFTFTLPAGTYNTSGTFTPPRDFAVNGAFPAPVGAFSIAGSIPSGTQNGVFTVTANGQSVSGTIPAVPATGATPTPRPGTTPAPNPTPVPTGGGHLTVTFSNATINASSAPFDSAGVGAVVGSTAGNFSSSYQVSNRNFNVVVLNTLAGGNYQPLTVGQQLGFNASGIGFPGKAQIIYTAVIGTTTGQWSARSGTLTITAITSSAISYRLNNVRFDPGLVNQAGTGSFTLNGTGNVSR